MTRLKESTIDISQTMLLLAATMLLLIAVILLPVAGAWLLGAVITAACLTRLAFWRARPLLRRLGAIRPLFSGRSPPLSA